MHARQTKRPLYSKAFVEFVLLAERVNPAAVLVDTPLVHLISTDGFAPTELTLAAAFAAVEANFTDYVAKALVLTGPRSIGAIGRANGGVVSWLMATDPMVTGNRIYGYWVEDADRVVLSEIFAVEDQIDMNDVGSALMLEVLLPLPYLVPLVEG